MFEIELIIFVKMDLPSNILYAVKPKEITKSLKIYKKMVDMKFISTLVYYFGLVNGISTFVGYLKPKLFSMKNSNGTI